MSETFRALPGSIDPGESPEVPGKELSRPSSLDSADPLPRFLRRLTHDLSSSLTAVGGFADLLKEHLGTDMDARSGMYLNRIARAVARTEEQLDHLRHFYQVEGEPPPLQPVALAELLPGIVEQVLDRVGEADFEVAEDLPVVLADPRLLHMALLEIVANAAIFVSPEVTAAVTVSSVRRNGWCELHVMDNGVGIAAEDRDTVLNPMVRACEEEIYPGLGLGLAIAQRAVDAVGGRLSLSDRDGGGTICRIDLKLA